ncbi:MAG: ATP synthase F1 subunit epsilon [Nannocystaceae bacterium]|nr:ATP synthase F1 subunit epsilon [bacterium]
MADVKLDILTPLGAVREGIEVAGVEVPGIQGELGLLPHHESLVTAVTAGVIRFKEGNSSVRIAVGSGFLEVKEAGRVVILVERAVESSDVDAAAAKSARDEARKELDAYKGSVDAPEYRALHDRWAWNDAQVRAAS